MNLTSACHVFMDYCSWSKRTFSNLTYSEFQGQINFILRWKFLWISAKLWANIWNIWQRRSLEKTSRWKKVWFWALGQVCPLIPPPLALFDISIWHIDCRYIDTFEKYRYRYRYRYGEVENIDIDIDIDRAILKNIDIDKVIPDISILVSISIWWFWKILISISILIRQFCKISISIKYRIDSNLAYQTGLPSSH